MEDTNTFNEYRLITLPYQRSGNDFVRPTQTRSQQAFPQQQVPPVRTQQRPAPAKMPKAQALALLRRLKRGIVVASFLSFGTFSALVVSHTVGTTTQQASTATSTQKTTSSATSTATKTTAPTSTPTKTSTQQATPTTTTNTQQGGSYGFGSSNSASNPVSGTHTS